MIKKIILHFNLVMKHKIKVFKLCFKAGIIWRGLVHDLSKFTPTEFFESAKYYKGNGSPISTCKYEKGYSRAWLHHIGRNKHHHEYWHEYLALDDAPIIPYVYTVELICDGLAAGIVYMGKNWTSIYQYNYYKKKSISYKINPLTNKFIEEVFLDISKYGINKVINKSYLKNKYKTLVLNDKDYKEY